MWNIWDDAGEPQISPGLSKAQREIWSDDALFDHLIEQRLIMICIWSIGIPQIRKHATSQTKKSARVAVESPLTLAHYANHSIWDCEAYKHISYVLFSKRFCGENTSNSDCIGTKPTQDPAVSICVAQTRIEWNKSRTRCVERSRVAVVYIVFTYKVVTHNPRIRTCGINR